MSAVFSNWRALLAVAGGAAVGGVARYAVGMMCIERFGLAFPYGTLFINVSGSFLIGTVIGYAESRPGAVAPLVRLFLTTGILGGYTTFSTFAFEAINLSGRASMLYVAGSVLLGLAAAFTGVAMARFMVAA